MHGLLSAPPNEGFSTSESESQDKKLSQTAQIPTIEEGFSRKKNIHTTLKLSSEEYSCDSIAASPYVGYSYDYEKEA